ncbi:hypothetical protein [Halosimplex sp. TS25]|uniref:hypothetical protein n=1 Tax=Halosimplex rarum TaxID=3396619 RepID=UPI0039EB0376
MSLTAIESGPASAQWLHGLWEYYREYTQTAIHAAAAAALTAFGLLVFVDPLFVVLAIASYLGPPIVLYSLDADAGKTADSSNRTTARADSRANTESDFDTDSDSDDGDSDADGGNGDADADADGVDADADG